MNIPFDPIRIFMVVSALLGCAYALHNWRDARRDQEALRFVAQQDRVLQLVAGGNVEDDITLAFAQLLLAVAAGTSMLVRNGPFSAGAIPLLFVYLFLFGVSVTLAYKSYIRNKRRIEVSRIIQSSRR